MELHLKIPVTILKDGQMYVAYSPVLDLSTYGKTFTIAQKRFTEAVEIFFEELESNGTTDEVLQNLGWLKSHKSWMPPLQVGHTVENISVPLVS